MNPRQTLPSAPDAAPVTAPTAFWLRAPRVDVRPALLAALAAGALTGGAMGAAHRVAGEPASALRADAAEREGAGARGVPLRLRLAEGPRTVWVLDPAAQRSEADDPSLPARRAARDVAETLLDRTEVLARVLVRAADEATLRAALAGHAGGAVRAPVGVRAVPGLAGGFIVEAASIADAALLADHLAASPGVASAEVSTQRPQSLRMPPSDSGLALQWHFRNFFSGFEQADANLDPAWNLGLSGEGVTIGMTELGFQVSHPDLVANVNESLSMTGGIDLDHGTSTAGIAGAVGNNGQGIAGAAYNATLCELVIGSDVQNTNAFLHQIQAIQVKNNSWGPTDNGVARSMTAIERAALETAVTTGRGGLGTVFVWSCGNGAASADRVDYDPYASSRLTIAVGAVGDRDLGTSYSEPGSSLFCVAPSSGNNRSIYTTRNRTQSSSGYWNSFGQTSAAAPVVSGIAALLLEARPDLTWRDVQHVLMRSARRVVPGDESWITNAAGVAHSTAFGFGAVDAGAAATLAQAWDLVAPEAGVQSERVAFATPIPDNDATGVDFFIDIDDPLTVEAVELFVDMDAGRLGDIAVTLFSPAGTPAPLAAFRGDGQRAYRDYRFTSLRTWGENARGRWRVNIADVAQNNTATVNFLQVRAYGTAVDEPACLADFNDDGSVGDIFDLFDFLAALDGGEAGADVAEPVGTIDLADLLAFLSALDAGCPAASAE